MSPPRRTVSIAGAGPAGSLLALLLRRRGFEVRLYERRADPRGQPFDSGRSINLAMAKRGIHALRHAGVIEHLRDTLIPMRGRMIHDRAGATSFQPYGSRPEEVIYSISRHRLNALLIDVAIRQYGARVEFECEVRGCDAGQHRLELGAPGAARAPCSQCAARWVDYEVLIAADGAGSAVRASLTAAGAVQARLEPLAHAYKELTIPAGPDGGHRMEREALHIWPRGDFMLIALPNPDGTFTATLFLDAARLDALRTPEVIDEFLSREFPDAAALMPERVAEFCSHPLGHLATVYAHPWHTGRTLLLGDAAHGVVPFHGQGMNCCFEDCVEFDALLDESTQWEALFAEFTRRRKPNTDAIAAMALENYLEMRERVADPRFQLQKRLSLELERRHPQRFIPRYTMVSFRHDIGYAEAMRRGQVQQRILEQLTAAAKDLDEIDYAQAAREIEAGLAPLDSTTINSSE
ncbi:MAG: FAD-dependent monooxygenase [Proteobacteria bacterium]|nr:FAD-dependent monooxygenase [Pseudomonadota bacterium]